MKISDYGITGNCRSGALISKNGSIDWCCLPDFDSPSVFGRLLDDDIGGWFAVRPVGDYATRQTYLNNTNILETRFTSADAEFSIYDFMTVYRTDESSYYNAPEIFRIIKVLRGAPALTLDYRPALNYARPTMGVINKPCIKPFTPEGRYESIYLYTSLSKEDVLKGNVIQPREESFL